MHLVYPTTEYNLAGQKPLMLVPNNSSKFTVHSAYVAEKRANKIETNKVRLCDSSVIQKKGGRIRLLVKSYDKVE